MKYIVMVDGEPVLVHNAKGSDDAVLKAIEYLRKERWASIDLIKKIEIHMICLEVK